MSDYGLIVRFTAQPGKRDTLAGILVEAAGHLQGVRGCKQWLVHAAASSPDAVWVTEVWTSKEEHDASLAHAAVRALVGRAVPLLAGPPETHETVPRGGVGL